MHFNNKVFIVTGASQGIGKELAYQLLQQNAKLIITGRNEDRLRLAKEELSSFGAVEYVVADMGVWEDCQQVADFTLTQYGKIDGIIHNAGMSAFGKVADMKREVIDEIINTNLRGVLYLTNLVLPAIRAQNGSVLFVGSIAGLHGLPDYSLYSLTKMSLTALAQSLHVEEAANGVFVGVAHIGFTENESVKKTLNASGEPVDVPRRNSLLTNSRQVTASSILRQLKRKKYWKLHSKVGLANHFMVRFFPRVLFTIFKWNYKG